MIINCDFYNINCRGSASGIRLRHVSAIIVNCDFYNISSSDTGIGVGLASATITNCDFYNISSKNEYGIIISGTGLSALSATIENCTFSAIESNDSNRYTSYYDLIKILPPETTGCRFLPEGKAQSIRFGNDCVINGKKVSDLLNS